MDAICRARQEIFRSRPRLLQHSHAGTTKCWVAHFNRYVPTSIEAPSKLDEDDRGSGVARHQRGVQAIIPHQGWGWRSMDELQDVLQIRDDFNEFTMFQVPNGEEVVLWQQIGMLPAAQGGRQRTVRQVPRRHITNVLQDLPHEIKKVVDITPNYD